MYSVSNAYVNALENSFISSRVEGTITLADTNKTKITFTDKDIVKNSLSVNNRCTNNGTFSLGSVYVGEMSVSLLNNIDRYSLFDAQIDLKVFVDLGDSTEEEIPMGTFFVDDSTRTKKILALTAYDAMTRFDEDLEQNTTGTPFDLISWMCEKCGVEMSQTAEDFSQFINHDVLLYLDTEKVGTYRDALSYITALMFGYATIDRTGKLFIGTFSTESSRNVTARRRTSATVADYHTKFCGVKVRFFANENYYPYTAYDEERSGLVLDMGDNPVCQGLDDTKNTVLQNILAELVNLNYVPVTMKTTPDPSLDLGDGITVLNVNGTDDSVFSIITSLTWNFQKEQEVFSEGANAKLDGVTSKEAKRITSIENNKGESGGLVVKTYTNARELSIGSSDTNVVTLSYSTNKDDTEVIFMATIPIEMSSDGNVVFTYFKGTTQRDELTSYLPKGKNIVTLVNHFQSDADEIVRLVLKARTEFFESDVRKHGAKIISLIDYVLNGEYVETEVDTSVPSASVPSGTIRAMVFSSAMNTTVAWDGTFEITEVIPKGIFIDKEIKIRSLSDDMEVVMNTNINKPTISDKIGLISIDKKVNVLGLSDEFGGFGSINSVITQQTVDFDLNDYTVKDDGGNIVLLEDVERQVLMSKNYNMLDDTILGVECAYVTASSDVVFAISVDDGVTWYMWTGEVWGTLTDTATGMSAETINAITTEQWAELMTTGQFKVRMTLFDENSSFTSFVMDYIN